MGRLSKYLFFFSFVLFFCLQKYKGGRNVSVVIRRIEVRVRVKTCIHNTLHYITIYMHSLASEL